MTHDTVWRNTSGLGVARDLLAAFAVCAALAACGGAAPGGGAPPDPEPPAGQDAVGKLVPVGADALVAHVRARLQASRSAAGGPGITAIVAPQSGSVTSASGPEDAAGSATVLQEAGVDEDDVLRLDGETVWALSPPSADGGQCLQAFTVADAGARLVPAGRLVLDPAVRFDGLFVDAPRRRVVVLGRRVADRGGSGFADPTLAPFGPVPYGASSSVLLIDTSDPVRPSLQSTLELAGELQATRVVDGRLWAVLRSQPRFDGFDWSWQTPAANERWLAALSSSAVLPAWRLDGGPARPLVDADACLVQAAAPGGVGAVTTVLALDLAAPAIAPSARCVATPVDAVLMTRDTLVLATVRHPVTATSGPAVSAAVVGEPVTDVHRFALASGTIVYRGSGSAPGDLGGTPDGARFRMSVDGARLRVLTGRDTGLAPGASPAQLTILEDRGDGALTPLATLPNARRPAPIGKPGERVHGVRFVGTRAYAVTFRRTDPVYVIDLADPADPALLGALEVPGFSDRLYPLTDRLLLGVGHDTADWNGTDVVTGVRISLIDVGDPSRPLERASRTIGQRGTRSATDDSPHGLMRRTVDGRLRIALPVAIHEGEAAPDAPGVPDGVRARGFTRLAAVRFEIDPGAPDLVDRAAVTAPGAAASGEGPYRSRAVPEALYDRAIDVGNTTWLWYDGRFEGAAW
jgi:hypothetical protein